MAGLWMAYKKKSGITKIEETEELKEKYKDCIFHKERWIKEDGLEQKLIVTYSLKYKGYQRYICTNLEDDAPAITKIDTTAKHNAKQAVKRLHA